MLSAEVIRELRLGLERLPIERVGRGVALQVLLAHFCHPEQVAGTCGFSSVEYSWEPLLPLLHLLTALEPGVAVVAPVVAAPPALLEQVRALLKGFRRLGKLAGFEESDAEAAVRHRKFRITLDGLVEGLEGFGKVPLAVKSEGQAIVSVCGFGIQADSLLVNCNGFVPLLLHFQR